MESTSAPFVEPQEQELITKHLGTEGDIIDSGYKTTGVLKET